MQLCQLVIEKPLDGAVAASANTVNVSLALSNVGRSPICSNNNISYNYIYNYNYDN